jgi:ribosomal protein L11 methyltransferase
MPSSKVRKKLFEVSVVVTQRSVVGLELVKALLVQWGVPLAEIIEEDLDGRKTVSFYCATRRIAGLFVSKFKKSRWRGIRVSVDVLYQDDWLTRWKKDWRPFSLTKTIDVVPVWCRKDYVPGKRKFILLDTISSFGTGLHETTRFMAQLIEMLRGKFDSCLDMGTGTGILALVALKTGAGDVQALDVDEMCVKAAGANFKANGYSARSITLQDVSKLKLKRSFDLVCANLVTHDLIRLKEKIIGCVKPGGWLAVSGVSLENLPSLRRGFVNLPLRCIRIKKGKKWTALLFRRTQV